MLSVVYFSVRLKIFKLVKFNAKDKALKKESLGGGDIKMMFVFGLLLDPLLGTFAVFLGSLIALPISLILLKKEREKVIPFGPFLLLALTFIYFSGLTTPMILEWLTLS